MDTPEQQLAAFRARIDAIDAALAASLVERTGIIREVAALKSAHWPAACHIRPGREGQMHRAIAERFAATDLGALAGLAIWRQLIGASTHLESPLSVSFLAAFPEHRWLAREYFGVQVGTHHAADITAALAQITSGASTILLMPADTSHPSWQHAAAIAAAGMRIFAALPVAIDNLPEGTHSALALAKLTPEDSGNDVSFFLEGNTITHTDGFTTTHANALFLGAHPRQITLGA